MERAPSTSIYSFGKNKYGLVTLKMGDFVNKNTLKLSNHTVGTELPSRVTSSEAGSREVLSTYNINSKRVQ